MLRYMCLFKVIIYPFKHHLCEFLKVSHGKIFDFKDFIRARDLLKY